VSQSRFPKAGAFETIIPQLTIAQVDDQDVLARAAQDVDAQLSRHYPRVARACSAFLIDNRSVRWETRAVFPTGSQKNGDRLFCWKG